MIRSNLWKILKNKGYTISKLSNKTGIGRTTLTSLTHNVGNGIQFETLEKLCAELKITPNDLLIPTTFNMLIRLDPIQTDTPGEIEFKSVLNNETRLRIGILIDTEKVDKSSLSVNVSIYDEDQYRYQLFVQSMPDDVIEIIKDEVFNAIQDEFQSNSESEIKIIFIDDSDFNKWDLLDIYEKLIEK